MSLTNLDTFGQKKDASRRGLIHGVVLDSAHNIVLRAATVAVYKAANNELVAYNLTNNYGEFSFSELPIGIALKITATFLGYKGNTMSIEIPDSNREFDIGKINLEISPKELNEVTIVSVPPVQMKGDTLEFNADAFQLDPNAQTEDLLRVLPGITVWADGAITMNGREIKSVLVNGKPFFGKDARIATQNIPKNIVSKIQVYQKNRDPEKPADSTAEMNIKLKKGKDFGYFGKLALGYGSGERYEGDGSLNFFNTRTQLGIAFSQNNVNKVANDINSILRNNTFKGTGANVEYQSDFAVQGLNKNAAGGLMLQHDFIPNQDYYNSNRLTTSYFLKNNTQNLAKSTKTITTLADGNSFSTEDETRRVGSELQQKAIAGYEKIKNGNKLSIEGKFTNSTNKDESNNTTLLLDKNKNQLSKNVIFDQLYGVQNAVSLSVFYQHKSIDRNEKWFSTYEINYKVDIDDAEKDQTYKSNYTTINNLVDDISLDRIYKINHVKNSQNLRFKLPNFGALFLGMSKPFGFSVGLQNDLIVAFEKDGAKVSDWDSVLSSYNSNWKLTNTGNEVDVNWRPALVFNRNIYRSLSGRYEKNFSTDIDVGLRMFDMKSKSEKDFQNISRAYRNFTPRLSFNYLNRQFGEFADSYSLQLIASSQYPTLQQIAPIVDDVNINFIQIGNSSLKEQKKREIQLSYNHVSDKSSNILAWSANVNAGYIDDYFASSNSFDDLRRATYSLINSNGYKFIKPSFDLRKSFKFKQGQLQFNISPFVTMEKVPNFIDKSLFFYNNLIVSYNPTINFTYHDFWEIIVRGKQSHIRYALENSKEDALTNLISQLEAGFALNCTKKLSVKSNIIHTNSKLNKSRIDAFTIWNASATYKLFKDNRAEIKLSALDILKQNTGLINYGFSNSISQGSVNVLRQYFMLSVAYFPRKFGR